MFRIRYRASLIAWLYAARALAEPTSPAPTSPAPTTSPPPTSPPPTASPPPPTSPALPAPSASPPPPAEQAPPPATSPAPPAEEPPAQEVVVRGERREIGATKLSASDARLMPGAFGDAFRAIEALPGVAPPISGLPLFFIRGAPPNDNGYFLDGIRVPLLFHVGLGPAVIHPGLLDHVDFYPGAAPASFGGFAGAIISGQTREPSPVAHGELNARLVDTGGLLEVPFAGERGTALIAGRYGYPGPILSAISETKLGYWDYQSRLSWRASDADTLSLLAFGSHDYLGHRDSTGVTVEDLVSDFHRIGLSYEHALRDGRVRLGVSLGYDSQGSNPTYLRDRSVAARIDFEQQLAPALRVRGGVQAALDVYQLKHEALADPRQAPMPASVDPAPTNVTTAAHLDLSWRVLRRIELEPGLRFGVFDSVRARSPEDGSHVRTTLPALDPRLSVRVVLAPALAWLTNFGISHQYPALRIGNLPALLASGAGFPAGTTRLQEVMQLSEGFELGLPFDLRLTASGFVSRSRGLTDLSASCIQIQPPSAPIGMGPRADDPYVCPSHAPVKGHAYGFELLLRRALTERLSGWLSYTLSRSVRQSHFVGLDGSDHVATVPSDFDRTHVLNAVLSYDLGRHWRVGTRLVFYSGAPYSTLAGNVPVPPYNGHRDPPFYRLDLRLEKRWLLGEDRSIAFVFDGQNLTLSQETNTLGLDCRGDITSTAYTTDCRRGKIGPLTIPSLGVDAIF